MKLKVINILVVVILQVTSSLAAPLQFQFLPPMGTMQQQQLALQEQLLAIQQFQAMQRFNPPSPVPMNSPQPLLLFFPDTQPNTEQDERYNKVEENNKLNKLTQEVEDDSDSVTIDADADAQDIDDDAKPHMRAILLVPNNPRFSLGSIISTIPFLPFEINVPDSLSWMYNGILGIISGIGQSWPFNRPQSGENQSEVDMKSVWKGLKANKVTPIVVIPLGQPVVSMMQG